MTPLEEGKKFTDEVYASKDEIQAYYNVSNVSSYWNHILSYRSFYDVQTKLKNTDGNYFKICLTRNIIANAYTLQTNLLNDLLLFISLSSSKQNKILLERKNESLKAVCKINKIKEPSEDILNKISLNRMESIPSSLFILDVYSKTYNQNYFQNGFNLKDLENISKGCAGLYQEDNPEYRQNENNDLSNPLSICDTNLIKALLVELNDYLNDEQIPVILRALTIPFAFSYIKPFEYFYEGVAALTSKNFLFSYGLKTMGFLLDFESISFSRSKEIFKYMKQSQDSLDLTYFIIKALPYLIEDEKRLKSLLLQVREEKEEETNEVEDESKDENSEITEFALPVFPVSGIKENIDDTAKKLREVYPQLKKKEAHFYAGHCTIGLKYTIDQFKEEEHTVYETARTSMESLAAKGFYKKEQYKNKFVYSPIPMKEKI